LIRKQFCTLGKETGNGEVERENENFKVFRGDLTLHSSHFFFLNRQSYMEHEKFSIKIILFCLDQTYSLFN